MSARGRLRIAWLGHRSSKLGGGMATYSREIIERLRERGAHVTFFTHGIKDEPELPVDDTVALDSHTLVRPLVFSGRRARRQLIDGLENHDFDLVHANFWFSSLDFELARTCRALGIPLVATFHVAFDQRMSVWGGLTSATYRLYSPVLAQCDRVIVFGNAQRATLIELGVPAERLVILPNGVDVNIWSPGESGWRERLGGAERLFVYMGRIDSEKNVDVLVRSFLDVAPPAGTRLAIVGQGTERRRLQRQYRDARVLFTGHVAALEDRVGILRAADAFFLPSQVEGLSLSMLEAMSCGVATVATDVGGDGEALRGAGILIDPRELDEQLHLAIQTLVDLPWVCEPLGRSARERVLERYSLDRNVDALLKLYREVAPAAEATA
jgi:glycosyltransferase involved in cell wall biosynthesis